MRLFVPDQIQRLRRRQLFVPSYVAPPSAPQYANAGTRLAGGTRTTTSIPAPANVVANDIVVVRVQMSPAPTPPGGFNAAGHVPITGSGGLSLRVYWKRATGAGEPSTYDFTHASASTEGWAFRLTGCVTSGSPIDADNSAANSALQAYPDISMSTTVANTLILWCGLAYQGYHLSSQTGSIVAEGVDDDSDYGDENYTVTQGSAGPTGTLSATARTGATSGKVVWIGAFKPPA